MKSKLLKQIRKRYFTISSDDGWFIFMNKKTGKVFKYSSIINFMILGFEGISSIQLYYFSIMHSYYELRKNNRMLLKDFAHPLKHTLTIHDVKNINNNISELLNK